LKKLRKRRKQNQKKKRITELKNKKLKDFFFQLDTKVIWCYSAKRYIFIAVDKNTEIAFAKMYKNKVVIQGEIFLKIIFSIKQ